MESDGHEGLPGILLLNLDSIQAHKKMISVYRQYKPTEIKLFINSIRHIFAKYNILN